MPTSHTPAFEPIPESEMAKHLATNRNKLIRYAKKHFKISEVRAEDLVGDLNLKVWEKRHLFDPKKGKLNTYLIRVLTNTFIDSNRSGKVNFNNNLLCNDVVGNENKVYEHEGVCQPDAMEASYHYQLLLTSIGLLPERYAGLIQGLVDDKSYEELAQEFDLPVGTIKTLVNRGRKLLAKALVLSGVVDAGSLGRYKYMIQIPGKDSKAIEQHRADILQASANLLGIAVKVKPNNRERLLKLELALLEVQRQAEALEAERDDLMNG